MPDGLGIGRAFVRTLPGFSKVIDGPFDEPRLRQMMRHKLRLCFRQFGELVFERFGDTAMQLLAPCPQHARVSSLLQQAVLEHARAIRWFATTDDQSGARELRRRALQGIAGKSCLADAAALRHVATDSSANR